MKKILFLCLSFIGYSFIYAQEFSKEFGHISSQELDLKTYDKDTDAEAIILFDIGESLFFDTDRGGYEIRFTRTKRIKILSKSGLQHAEVSIPFYVDGYGKTERVISVEAYTYNFENNKLNKKALDPKTIFEETKNQNWKVKKFIFPDVKEGSIIEYKYTIETPFHFNLPDWAFQDVIPTLYSKYTVRMIPFYEYVFLLQGANRFDQQHSTTDEYKRTLVGTGLDFQDVAHTYVMKEVPAFKNEAYITSPDDYIIKLDFQLAKYHSPYGGTTEILTTWPKLIEDLLKHDNFGKYVKNSEKHVKKIVESNAEWKGKTELELSRMIIEFVKSNFSWNGNYAKYASKTPNAFMSQKTGNSADINLFLLALLSEAGLDAKPVILSTRNHGKIKIDYPYSHFFNYMVVLVATKEQTFLTDATEDILAYNRIPLRCINEKGLVIDKVGAGWVLLENNSFSLDNKTIRMNVEPEKSSTKVEVTISTTEYESFLYRNSFKDDTTRIKKYLLENDFINVKNVATFNYAKKEQPYIISFAGEAPIERIGDVLAVSPFLSFPMKENGLTEESRSFPIDFIYPKTEKFKSLLSIPNGFSLSNLPEGLKLNDDLIEIDIEYTVTDNLIEASALYTFKKSVYQPKEYSKIKYYLDEIVRKVNEKIIFEKI